jgi:phospholipid/cholesterol/gamma-HCH transport system substrate-binding protein
MPEFKVRRSRFEARQLRVVVLAIVGILLLGYGAYRVGKVFDVFSSRYEIITLVPSVVGLREGAPVTLAGQRIGQVAEIAFIPVPLKTGENNLRVTLAIAREVQEQVRSDSRAFLRTQGLLGDKFVDIAPGTSGAAILQPGDTVASGQTVDLEEFLTRAATALDAASLIVEELHTMTEGIARGEGTVGALLRDDELYGRMLATTTELQGTLRQINSADGTLGRLLRDPMLYDRLTLAVGRVDSLGGALLDGDGTLARLLRSDSLYQALVGVAANADTAMGGVQGIVTRLGQSDGTLNKLIEDPQLYEAFLKAVVDLQSLIADIRQNPDRFKPSILIDVF